MAWHDESPGILVVMENMARRDEDAVELRESGILIKRHGSGKNYRLRANSGGEMPHQILDIMDMREQEWAT
jgi:hypothetical protein